MCYLKKNTSAGELNHLDVSSDRPFRRTCVTSQSRGRDYSSQCLTKNFLSRTGTQSPSSTVEAPWRRYVLIFVAILLAYHVASSIRIQGFANLVLYVVLLWPFSMSRSVAAGNSSPVLNATPQPAASLRHPSIVWRSMVIS